MKVIYKGSYPIRFISMEDGAKLINPNDSFEMSDELYNTEYKDDPRYEAGSTKKTKKTDEGAE